MNLSEYSIFFVAAAGAMTFPTTKVPQCPYEELLLGCQAMWVVTSDWITVR